MSRSLLFCVAEVAKQIIPQILALRGAEDVYSTAQFFLVESRVCPTSSEGFKLGLGVNETFETDFIGASDVDCQQWAQEKAAGVNFIVPELITIADARTAKDHTILIQSYQPEAPPETDDLELPWPPFGILPPRDKSNTWWSYRVDMKDALEVLLDLGEFGILEVVLPYYGYKDRLTDERGVFSVSKARRITLGEDPETVLGEDPGNSQSYWQTIWAYMRFWS